VAGKYTYRNLIVWERAQALALAVLRIVQRLPNSWGNAVIARQIVASATSVGANIAEGHGRFTPGAHRNHLSIAKGSAAETDSWLDLLRRAGHISDEEEAALHAECQEIMAMLTSKILELQKLEREASKQVQEDREMYVVAGQEDLPPPPFTPEDYRQ